VTRWRRIASLFKQYRVNRIRGDRYAGEWPAEAFAHHQIRYEPAEHTRAEIYLEVIPMFTAARVRLLDHRKCIDQFAGLRRKVQPGGREQIDHAPNAHDDVSNAAAGVMTLCVARKQPMQIAPEVLYRSQFPASMQGMFSRPTDRGVSVGRSNDGVDPHAAALHRRLYPWRHS
jgi:hypothetical protein